MRDGFLLIVFKEDHRDFQPVDKLLDHQRDPVPAGQSVPLSLSMRTGCFNNLTIDLDGTVRFV
jgi:hypothetical protein